ncbi:MAG: hypothetical protein C4332_09890 [Meiothermus sp.]
MLIRHFGVDGLEALLDQGAIEFVLEASVVACAIFEVEGILPLQHGSFSSAVHSDLEASIKLSFSFMTHQPKRSVRRALTRQLVKAYETVPNSLAEQSIEWTYENYQNGAFAELGMERDTPLDKAVLDRRKALDAFAEEAMELAVLARYRYNSDRSYQTMKLIGGRLKRFQRVGLVKDFTDEIFRIEELPNFAELIHTGVIEAEDIPNLRRSKNMTKFRN